MSGMKVLKNGRLDGSCPGIYDGVRSYDLNKDNQANQSRRFKNA